MHQAQASMLSYCLGGIRRPRPVGLSASYILPRSFLSRAVPGKGEVAMKKVWWPIIIVALSLGLAGPAPAGTVAQQKGLVLVAQMQAILDEAVEEAWAYLLSNDASERQDFMDRMNEFDKHAAELKKLFPKRGDLACRVKMLKTKGDMFDLSQMLFREFKEQGDFRKLPPKALLNFKVKVIEALEATDACLKDLMAANQDLLTAKGKPSTASQAEMSAKKGPKLRAALQVLRMQSTVMRGAGEAMCYPVIMKAQAKADFQARMDEFDKLAAALPAGFISGIHGPAVANTYQDILTAKKKMQSAGQELISAAAHQTLTPAVIKTFEDQVDALDALLDSLVLICRNAL
ncbi:MAG: hypothetical protein HY794_01085 [Desulfarculus sp.]|nr:hypothetical protein [Desulfarculus sp.]